MNYQNFINTLSEKNANYNNPEQAITTANLCDTISRDINTDSKRFVYELLQNADDASSKSGILDIQINFINDYVIVSHKGEGFSEIDIESISSAGDGTKAGDNNKTGFKGIGFKSVFSHSHSVTIKSGNYCFKFDKEHWQSSPNNWRSSWESESKWKAERINKNKDETLKMPWQIIPVWSELPNELENLTILEEYNVSTIIRYDDVEMLKTDLDDLFSKSQIVLFLRSKEIKISINTERKTILEKNIVGNKTILKRNDTILSEWLIKTEPFPIPKDVRAKVNEDEKSPKKLKEAEFTEISFAIQLENGKLKAVEKDNRLIFTYLPTSINYDFPFLVNASFLTDAGRQNLHQDTFWNNWIFKQIPLKYFKWIEELANKKSEYNKQFLKVIPHKLRNSPLEISFNDGYDEALETIAFIPNKKGDLLKVKEAILDKTNISDCIDKQTVINYINNSKFTSNSFVQHLEPNSKLKDLGVRIFDIKDLKDFFDSTIFKKQHKPEENFKLISFLYKQTLAHRSQEEKSIWNEKLKETSFIFSEEEELKQPNHVYFPSITFSNEFTDEISIVHEDTVNQINENSEVKNWLEYLGVKEPSDISFIEKNVIGQGDTFVTEENAIQIGRYLFNAHKKGVLEQKHYTGLKNLNLQTQEGNLVKASDSFLADFYEPELLMEKTYDKDFYTSQEYFTYVDIKSEWKTFFIKIGVNQTISWIEKNYKRYELGTTFPVYLSVIPDGAPNALYNIKNSFTSYNVNLISFIDIKNDYYFFKKFWDIVFKKNLNTESSNEDEGISYYKRSIQSLNEWIIKNEAIFPTTQKTCLPASSVYSSGIDKAKEICGKYLPVFEYDKPIPPNWLNYINFKDGLGLEEYLQILSSIWKDDEVSEQEVKENKKRIRLIYEKLAAMKLHETVKDKIREWSKSNKLLAKNSTDFYSPNELQLVTVDGFNKSTLVFTNGNDSNIIELMRLFGVQIIDKVYPIISNGKVEITDLKTKLLQVAPLIALVSIENKNVSDWQTEYNRIIHQLSHIHFFETDDIHISYGNDDDKQKRSSWAEKDNFYYVGKWHSPRVLDGLVKPLGSFLKFREERFLTILLLESFAEGVEYLKEKGFDTSLIPEKLINQEETVRVINQSNTPYNQSDEDLGKQGELHVFKELKRIYTERYKQLIEETTTGFKIGNHVEVIWRNILENTKANHDFKVIEGNSEIYVDSKATAHGKNIEKIALYISGNELDLMETAEKYLIARVYNATSTNPTMELVRLKLDTL